MKQIPLKVTAITLPDGSQQPLDYREYIRGIMRMPMNPQEGISIEEMYGSVRILEAVDNSKDGTLNLEDTDYAFFQRKIKAARFMTVDAAIVQFIEDVTE